MSRYGRNHVIEPLSSLRILHRHDGSPLRTASHEPPIPVLDQEDLIAQGIDTSVLVPGAARAAALGSCVANAGPAALAAAVSPARLAALGLGPDPVAGEEYAIRLYHAIGQGTPDDWPPADQGSSGLALCAWLEREGLVAGHRIARDPEAILSLLQAGPVLAGQPFLKAWEEPGPDHFIDGDGSEVTLARQLAGGVAGGHETLITAAERIGYDALGRVDADATVLRFRNSWGAGWADGGSAYVHLSTFAWLMHWCDFRALVPVTEGN